MHRKFKKVIEIADYWLQYPMNCEFSEGRPAAMEVVREEEAYTVLVSRPSHQGVLLRIVPKGRPLNSFSEKDRENIAYNETNLFRISLMFQEMEEKQIHLDKKGRQQLRDHLARREAEQQGRL